MTVALLSSLAVYLLGVSFWFGVAFGERIRYGWGERALFLAWPVVLLYGHGIKPLRIPCRLKGHDDRRVTLELWGDRPGPPNTYGVQCRRCKRVEELA